MTWTTTVEFETKAALAAAVAAGVEVGVAGPGPGAPPEFGYVALAGRGWRAEGTVKHGKLVRVK